MQAHGVDDRGYPHYGATASDDNLNDIVLAIEQAKQPQRPPKTAKGTARPSTANSTLPPSELETSPIVIVLSPDYGAGDPEKFAAYRTKFYECGAASVVVLNPPFEVWNAKGVLTKALEEAYAGREMPVVEHHSVDKLGMLFEIKKRRTKFKHDLLCAGGLLDMVRGSITCTTEEEVQSVYNIALDLTFSKDSAEVVRVKNGFHTPVTGGYCDLKLFVQVAHEAGESNFFHICELQVHLDIFLEQKKFTHMPYVIDRGDFDHG